jgi:hypothetical protein
MVYGDTLEDRFGSDWVQKTNEEFDLDPNKELPYSVIAEVTATPINAQGEVDDTKIQLLCKTLTKGVIKKAGWEKLKNATNNWNS